MKSIVNGLHNANILGKQEPQSNSSREKIRKGFSHSYAEAWERED
jgi:hypothetical protein